MDFNPLVVDLISGHPNWHIRTMEGLFSFLRFFNLLSKLEVFFGSFNMIFENFKNFV
jgi:hypothetical protein